MTHTCPVCSRDFIGHRDRVYCSRSCSGRGNIAANLTVHWKHLRKVKRSFQDIHARHKARLRTPVDPETNARLVREYVLELRSAK